MIVRRIETITKAGNAPCNLYPDGFQQRPIALFTKIFIIGYISQNR